MRVLALDYGSARCGCALSDPTGELATPIDPVQRPGTRRGLQRLLPMTHQVPLRAGLACHEVGRSDGSGPGEAARASQDGAAL